MTLDITALNLISQAQKYTKKSASDIIIDALNAYLEDLEDNASAKKAELRAQNGASLVSLDDMLKNSGLISVLQR